MGLGNWGRGYMEECSSWGNSMCEDPEVRSPACSWTHRKDHCERSVVNERESIVKPGWRNSDGCAWRACGLKPHSLMFRVLWSPLFFSPLNYIQNRWICTLGDIWLQGPNIASVRVLEMILRIIGNYSIELSNVI